MVEVKAKGGREGMGGTRVCVGNASVCYTGINCHVRDEVTMSEREWKGVTSSERQ